MDPTAQTFIAGVQDWARAHSGIVALALVGSHARGAARPDSDIDFVLVCNDIDPFLANIGWTRDLGTPTQVRHEDWGLVKSVRVLFDSNIEAEFGFTTQEWVTIPPPEGTMDVLKDGAVVLFDRGGNLNQLVLRASGG